MRRLSELELEGLRAATRLLIERAGGLRMAGEVVGRGKTTLGRYYERGASGAGADLFAPIDVVAELERFTAAPLVTAALAERAGHALLPLPPALGDPNLTRAVGRVAKETGEAIARIGGALADDRLSPREAKACFREIDEARAALMTLRAAIGEVAGRHGRAGR